MLKSLTLVLLTALSLDGLASEIGPGDLDYGQQQEAPDFIFFPVQELSGPGHLEGVVWYRNFSAKIASIAPSEAVPSLTEVHIRVVPVAQENGSYNRFFAKPGVTDHGAEHFGFWNPHQDRDVCSVSEEIKALLSPLPWNPVILPGGLPEACDVTLTVHPAHISMVKTLVDQQGAVRTDMSFMGCDKNSPKVLWNPLLEELEALGTLTGGKGDFYEVVWELHELTHTRPELFAGHAKEVIRSLLVKIWKENEGGLPQVTVSEHVRLGFYQSCQQKEYQARPGGDS